MSRTRGGADQSPDWSTLPPEYTYLVGPAEEYGHLMALGRPLPRRLKSSERKQLHEVALQIGWNNHQACLHSWVIERSIAGDKLVADLLEGLMVLLDHLGFGIEDYGPKQEPEWTLRLWEVLHYRVLWLMVDELRDIAPNDQAFKAVLNCLDRVPQRDLPEIAFGMLHPVRTDRALDWIEGHIGETVSPWHWGWLAAVSNFSWRRAEAWLISGRPLSLVALDALNNMGDASESPVVQEVTPTLTDRVPFHTAASVLGRYMAEDPALRVQRSVESILKRWSTITG